MKNFFKKLWRRVAAALNLSLDKNTSPEVLMQQLMDEARDKDRKLHNDAITAISISKQRQINLATAVEHRDKIKANLDAGLKLAEKNKGNEKKLADIMFANQTIGSELLTSQTSVDQLMVEVSAAQQTEEKAKQAHRDMQAAYRTRMEKQRQTMGKIADAKLAKSMAAVMEGMDQTLQDSAAVNWDMIDGKVNAMMGDGLAAQELAEGSVDAQMREIQRSAADDSVAALLASTSASLGLTVGQPEEATIPIPAKSSVKKARTPAKVQGGAEE